MKITPVIARFSNNFSNRILPKISAPTPPLQNDVFFKSKWGTDYVEYNMGLNRERAIYVIHHDKSYIRFDDPKAARKETGLSINAIVDYIRPDTPNNLDRKNKKGFAVVSAGIIEDGNGNPKQHIIDLYAEKIFTGLLGPSYAVNEQGDLTSFKGPDEAMEFLNINFYGLQRHYFRPSDIINGYRLVDGLWLETDDPNNPIDQKKLMAIRKKIHKNALYVVETNGAYSRYYNRDKVIEDGKLIIGKGNTLTYANDCYIIKAEDVDDLDENNKYVLNEDKLKEAFEKMRENSIYVVKQDGKYKRYNSLETKINGKTIEYKKYYAQKEGYTVIDVPLAESKDENGHYYMDWEKIRKYLNQ